MRKEVKSRYWAMYLINMTFYVASSSFLKTMWHALTLAARGRRNLTYVTVDADSVISSRSPHRRSKNIYNGRRSLTYVFK